MPTLTGITWDHSRGFVPLVATAQRFHELHPEVDIHWEKRSLQAFADAQLETLAERYDFLVIDHPHAGIVAAKGALLPLDKLLPAAFLADQAAHQVGRSHDTYVYGGHPWALAIDAATPVASWRPDRLPDPPTTWRGVLHLASEGRVAVPAIPIDSLMNFYTLCVDQGEAPFASREKVVSEAVGLAALKHLRELIAACPAECLERNPIRVYEALVRDDDPADYCPFAYGYTNYAREGYAARRLCFGDVVTGPSGKPLRTTLGGTGLAVSARCAHRKIARDYLAFTAAADTQRTLFTQCGGQPGHRAAWLDAEADRLCGGFFGDTLATHDRAFIRPRYDGAMHFQDMGCLEVHAYLRGKQDAAAALAALNAIYRESLRRQPALETVTAS